MTGLPTILVELDDGTGTFPFDITAYAHMPTGIGVTYGRQDEFSDVEAARLSLRLDNVDGRFTVGAPTYDVFVDQQIRFTETVGATVSKRFTGYVQDWPLTWPSPTASMATVTISAFDRFTRLARPKLRSLVENEIVSDSPLAYYTLGEAEGSVSAGDTSGNGNSALTMAGTGTAVTFGTATGPAFDDLTAATFAGGKYLWGVVSPVLGEMSVECFFSVPSIPAANAGLVLVAEGVSASASLNLYVAATTGFPGVDIIGGGSIVGATSVADGATHHFAVTVTGAGDVTAYIDGVSIGTAVEPTLAFDYVRAGSALSGVLAHVAAYDTWLTGARVAAHSAAGLTGFAEQPSDERLVRLASYAGLAAGDLDLEAGVLDTPTQQTNGISRLDAMRAVATAEDGVLFVAGDGRLTFHNRTHRVATASTAATIAITAADVDHDDLTISTDKTYLQNTVTGSRAGGATQTVVSAASVATYDEYPGDYSDLLVTTDAEVLARINWQAGAYDDVAPRLSSVTIDLLTSSTATQQAVLAAEIGDRLTISGMPTQSPFATADLIIEGWTERVTNTAWSVTFNTAPAELFRAWILGDATYGVLGSTTRLHF